MRSKRSMPKEFGIFLALIIIVGIISFIEPSFLSRTSIFSLLRQVSFVAIMALGVYVVIITSGIDLSIGSVFAVSGVTCGMAMAAGAAWPLAVLVGLLGELGNPGNVELGCQANHDLAFKTLQIILPIDHSLLEPLTTALRAVYLPARPVFICRLI